MAVEDVILGILQGVQNIGRASEVEDERKRKQAEKLALEEDKALRRRLLQSQVRKAETVEDPRKKLLTVEQAAALGKPYGTTEGDLIGETPVKKETKAEERARIEGEQETAQEAETMAFSTASPFVAQKEELPIMADRAPLERLTLPQTQAPPPPIRLPRQQIQLRPIVQQRMESFRQAFPKPVDREKAKLITIPNLESAETVEMVSPAVLKEFDNQLTEISKFRRQAISSSNPVTALETVQDHLRTLAGRAMNNGSLSKNMRDNILAEMESTNLQLGRLEAEKEAKANEKYSAKFEIFPTLIESFRRQRDAGRLDWTDEEINREASRIAFGTREDETPEEKAKEAVATAEAFGVPEEEAGAVARKKAGLETESEKTARLKKEAEARKKAPSGKGGKPTAKQDKGLLKELQKAKDDLRVILESESEEDDEKTKKARALKARELKARIKILEERASEKTIGDSIKDLQDRLSERSKKEPATIGDSIFTLKPTTDWSGRFN